MRKLLIVCSLMLALAAQAGVTSTTVTSGTCSNLTTLLSGGCEVNYLILTSATNNAGNIRLYDCADTTLKRINAEYTTISQYATNYVSTWTNYYGATNSVTNVSLATITNTVAAATNNLTPVFTLSTGTNSSTTFSGLNTRFVKGLAVTNTGLGTVSVTIGYTQ